MRFSYAHFSRESRVQDIKQLSLHISPALTASVLRFLLFNIVQCIGII